MEIRTNQSEQSWSKPRKRDIAIGFVAGSSVNTVAKLTTQNVNNKLLGKLIEVSSNVSKEEVQQISEGMSQVLQKTGLAEKGVEVVKTTTENLANVKNIIFKEVNKGISKYLPNVSKEANTNMLLNKIKDGENAMYAFVDNKIIMPEKGIECGFFHEAGHALNANFSKVGKFLQKSRSAIILASPILLIALLKNKKADNQKPKNKIDKVTDFIKENAGKLTFALNIPILLEEGMATMKGNKLAKSVLSPQLAKKVAKTNRLGFATYLCLAVVSGVGVYLATKVRDAIVHGKRNKDNAVC